MKWERHKQERVDMLASGKAVRCSALGAGERVHVLFEKSGGVTIGKWMSGKTYDAFPLLDNVTLEMFEAVEGVALADAPSGFYGN